MHKRHQLDLLGLVIGALEDHEQAEFADKCRKDARLCERYTRWRQRLQILTLLMDDCDPPSGLAERTSAFVFSQLEGASPAGQGGRTAHSFVRSENGRGRAPAEVSHRVCLRPVATASCCQSESADRLSRGLCPANTSPRRRSSARHLAPSRAESNWRDAARQKSTLAGSGSLAGAFSHPAWMQVLALALTAIIILSVVPPALYESRVQSESFRCQHLLCWLRGIGDHLALLHGRSLSARGGESARSGTEPTQLQFASLAGLPVGPIGSNSDPWLVSPAMRSSSPPHFYIAFERRGGGEGTVWILQQPRHAVTCARPIALVGSVCVECGDVDRLGRAQSLGGQPSYRVVTLVHGYGYQDPCLNRRNNLQGDKWFVRSSNYPQAEPTSENDGFEFVWPAFEVPGEHHDLWGKQVAHHLHEAADRR